MIYSGSESDLSETSGRIVPLNWRRLCRYSSKKYWLITSFADPEPGSGIRCFISPDLGSRTCFFQTQDLGPPPYLCELSNNLLVKKFKSLSTGSTFLLYVLFKNKIIFDFVKFTATQKGNTITFFIPDVLFFVVFGSGIRDRGSGIWTEKQSGSGFWYKHPGFATLHHMQPLIFYTVIADQFLTWMCLIKIGLQSGQIKIHIEMIIFIRIHLVKEVPEPDMEPKHCSKKFPDPDSDPRQWNYKWN